MQILHLKDEGNRYAISKKQTRLILGTITAVSVQAENVYTFDEVVVSATKTTRSWPQMLRRVWMS